METGFADEMCHGEWVIRQLNPLRAQQGVRRRWNGSNEDANRVCGSYLSGRPVNTLDDALALNTCV